MGGSCPGKQVAPSTEATFVLGLICISSMLSLGRQMAPGLHPSREEKHTEPVYDRALSSNPNISGASDFPTAQWQGAGQELLGAIQPCGPMPGYPNSPHSLSLALDLRANHQLTNGISEVSFAANCGFLCVALGRL